MKFFRKKPPPGWTKPDPFTDAVSESSKKIAELRKRHDGHVSAAMPLVFAAPTSSRTATAAGDTSSIPWSAHPPSALHPPLLPDPRLEERHER